jgi:hypothetical protein
MNFYIYQLESPPAKSSLFLASLRSNNTSDAYLWSISPGAEGGHRTSIAGPENSAARLACFTVFTLRQKLIEMFYEHDQGEKLQGC